MNPARREYQFIAEAVPHHARVLDLGCGDGELLAYLRAEKSARVQGVEVDLRLIAACAERDIPVVQADIDHGLPGFADNAYDVVVLSQTLQVIKNPALALREILRIARTGIITFPNFGHWTARAHLAFRGRMPVSKTIPYSWDETPNIHHTTLTDFRDFVRKNGAVMRKEYPLRTGKHGERTEAKLWPNLFADTVAAVIQRR